MQKQSSHQTFERRFGVTLTVIIGQKFFATAFALIDRLHDFKKASIVICTFFEIFLKIF